MMKKTLETVPEKKKSKVGPSSGRELLGCRSAYMRSKGAVDMFYKSVRYAHDISDFEIFTGKTVNGFDEIVALFWKELQKQLSIHFNHTIKSKNLPRPRKRARCKETMVFIFLHLLQGENEGGVEMGFMAHMYGFSKGTIYNYIQSLGMYLYKVIPKKANVEIKWRNAEERKCQEGMIYAFPKAVDFVDGTRIKTFRRVSNKKSKAVFRAS